MALSLESLHQTAPRVPSEPSPVVSGRGGGGAGEGSVLWSQEDVAQEDLARPHTSNPRYSEIFGVETPRVTPASLRLESPSRTSNDTTSAVLWASEARDIKPSMLARPTTSNPWLHSFLDSVPDAKSPQAGSERGVVDEERQRSLILWSEKAIEDWRLLARPHASNPAYESSANAVDGGEGANNQRGLSEVLWSNDDATAIGKPTVPQLQEVVVAQAARISELEREVTDLRLRLNVVGELATCRPSSAHQRRDTTPPRASRATQEAAQSESQPATRQPERPSTRMGGTRNHNAAERAHEDAVQSSSDVLNLSPESATHEQGPAKEDTAQRHVCVDPAPVDVIEDTDSGDDGAEALFKREAAADEGRSTFADRLRAKTATGAVVARPDTAAPKRSAVPVPAPVARPVSAPVTRRDPAAWKTDDFPSSFAGLRGEAVTSDSNITAAYRALLMPGCDVVTKAAFSRMYKARAEQYGIMVTEQSLTRLLKPYSSAGADMLSYDEFAVLFLQFQRW